MVRPTAPADASTAGATSGTPTATPSPTATVTSSVTATATSPSPRPGPAPGPTTQRDAGAPSQTKDAGAPAPDKDDKEDKAEAERNATLGKAAEAQCANHRRQMTTFARDEATRKRAATQAKTFMCRGMASSRCERQVCMEACLVLGDQACIQQMKYVMEHGPAPKY